MGEENGTSRPRRVKRETCERYKKMDEAFSMAMHCVLTACSREECMAHFPFVAPERQSQIYELYTEVVAAVHKTSKMEFDAICAESKVKSVLAGIDKRIYLDSAKRRNAIQQKQTVSPGLLAVRIALDVKQAEVEELKRILVKVEEQKSLHSARIESMRTEIETMEGNGNYAFVNLKQALVSSE